MEWLAENWYWIVGAIFVFIFLRGIAGRRQKSAPSRPRQGQVIRQPRQQPGGRQLTQVETDAILVKLTNALEHVVDEVVGRHFTRADRQKIALGMIAVMMAENISPDHLIRNSDLFVTIMFKSIDALAQTGQISIL